MMLGLLPPNSNVTTLRLLSADAFKIFRPVRMLPVNAIFSMSGWWLIASPTIWPGCMKMTCYLGRGREMKWFTIAIDDVYDTRGNTSFVNETSEFQRSKRRNFGRLNKGM